MNNQLTPFEGEKIRKTWYNEEWYFVIEDIIFSLTASSNPKGYIRDMRRRDPILSQGWGQIAHTLAVQTTGGKQRMNCANTEGVFRLLMSVPSPKAEPLKLWLASLGKQAIDEAENPELLSERQTALYKAKGYSDEWIKRRMQTLASKRLSFFK